MTKIFTIAAPLALTLAAALLCGTAQADQPGNNTTTTTATAPAAADMPVQQLTRQQVYDQLVQAQKDGSLARMNATYIGS